MASAFITGIFIYPVKSCAAISLPEVLCSPIGLDNDRRWAIIDESGKLLTQRDDPRLALITPQIAEDGTLTLSGPDMPQFHLPRTSSDEERLTISKWGQDIACFDEGVEAANLLSSALGYRCRLVGAAQTGKNQSPPIQRNGSPNPFNDCCL